MEELEWNDESYDGARYANGAARLYAAAGYYITQTCTGEIKDNGKKKIQRRIAHRTGWGRIAKEKRERER